MYPPMKERKLGSKAFIYALKIVLETKKSDLIT
jgi:hypothetical protein